RHSIHMVNRSSSQSVELMNKKAIFFTSVTIVIITLFLISYTFYANINERKTVQKRVETMNDFVLSVEEDIPRKLFISGFRSIFIFENKIIDTGQYISNLENSYEEMFFSGTYGGVSQELLIGTTFTEIANYYADQGAKLNINISLLRPDITIDQIDPWNVRINLIADLRIVDSTGLASWNKTLNSSGFIET